MGKQGALAGVKKQLAVKKGKGGKRKGTHRGVQSLLSPASNPATSIQPPASRAFKGMGNDALSDMLNQ
jgi:hypothetical protein